MGAAVMPACPEITVAPSLAGQAVEVIETRLKEEVDDALKQLHTLDEHLTAWERAD